MSDYIFDDLKFAQLITRLDWIGHTLDGQKMEKSYEETINEIDDEIKNANLQIVLNRIDTLKRLFPTVETPR